MAKLERLRLQTRHQHLGRFSARQRSPKLGSGLEFAAHRPYTPGDDFKNVDWTLYGRLERFYVRQSQEETELNINLLVDVSASMNDGEPAKSELARELATALAYLGLSQLDRVTVAPFGSELAPPRTLPRRKAQAVNVYRMLAQLQHEGPKSLTHHSDLGKAARQLAATSHDRGLAIIVSDFLYDSDWRDGLQVLRVSRFEPALIHLSSPAEIDPPLGGELLLNDAETGETLRLEVDAAMKRRYRDAFNAHQSEIETWCRDHGFAYSHVRSDRPVDEVVLDALRSGRLVA